MDAPAHASDAVSEASVSSMGVSLLAESRGAAHGHDRESREEEEASAVLFSRCADPHLVYLINALVGRGHEFEHPLSVRVAREMRRLKWPLCIYVVLCNVVLVVQAVCVVQGAELLWQDKSPWPCSLLRYWAAAYSLTVPFVACLPRGALPLLFVLLGGGLLLRRARAGPPTAGPLSTRWWSEASSRRCWLEWQRRTYCGCSGGWCRSTGDGAAPDRRTRT